MNKGDEYEDISKHDFRFGMKTKNKRFITEQRCGFTAGVALYNYGEGLHNSRLKQKR
ncbi:MAG: hypothetical protein RIR11_4584 [Bacteroidota bacterium]|jgi:hypothetical protein